MDRQEDALREFGRRIGQLREQRGIGIGDLASRAGLDPRELAAIEAGHQDIPITTIFRLAEGLGVSPAELLGPP
jgi:transcriptional regulator with XRE-family HTH domain